MGRSSFLSSGLSVVSFIYLITSAPPPCGEPGGVAWSGFSSVPLTTHPRSNLLLAVPDLFLAPTQLSRSTEALPGLAQAHCNLHLSGREREEGETRNPGHWPGLHISSNWDRGGDKWRGSSVLPHAPSCLVTHLLSQPIWKESLRTLCCWRAVCHSS